MTKEGRQTLEAEIIAKNREAGFEAGGLRAALSFERSDELAEALWVPRLPDEHQGRRQAVRPGRAGPDGRDAPNEPDSPDCCPEIFSPFNKKELLQ